MIDSITVTREQVEDMMKAWLKEKTAALSIGYYDDGRRTHLARTFTTALFNNVGGEPDYTQDLLDTYRLAICRFEKREAEIKEVIGSLQYGVDNAFQTRGIDSTYVVEAGTVEEWIKEMDEILATTPAPIPTEERTP